jgi:hypothetical protein
LVKLGLIGIPFLLLDLGLVLIAATTWAVVFVAALAGQQGHPLGSKDAEAPLQRMVDAIKAGSHGSFIPFGRDGKPVIFEYFPWHEHRSS